MSIFTEGGVRRPAPQSSKKFLQRVYSVASATASAVEQHLYTTTWQHSAFAAASSSQTITDCWPP